ncbi:hypothetical protein J4G37_59650, partial [Microvirga sp. 3-52]|nr:hypothetical protein [Microvirga sp. 3-52]
ERIINSIDKETGRIGDSLWSEIEDLSMSPNVKVLKFSEAPIKSTLRYDKWKWLYVRMGISLNIFDQTVNYLRNRKIGDQEQIKLDLIKADIAQFLTQYTSI